MRVVTFEIIINPNQTIQRLNEYLVSFFTYSTKLGVGSPVEDVYDRRRLKQLGVECSSSIDGCGVDLTRWLSRMPCIIGDLACQVIQRNSCPNPLIDLVRKISLARLGKGSR